MNPGPTRPGRAFPGGARAYTSRLRLRRGGGCGQECITE